MVKLKQINYLWLNSKLNRKELKGLACSPMTWETWVQSQVESYQRLKKWYLMPPCLTFSIIRGKRVNPGKGVAPSPTLGVVAIEKGAFGSPWTTVANITYIHADGTT